MTHYLGLHVWRKIAKGITDQGNRGPRPEVPKIIDQPDDIADEDGSATSPTAVDYFTRYRTYRR